MAGQYLYLIQCAACGHAARKSLQDLAKYFPKGTNRPEDLAAKLVCSRCGAKGSARLEIGFRNVSNQDPMR